jgi:hypothetical protein
MNNKSLQFHVEGCWELRSEGKAICRWFISYQKSNSERFVGAVGGYLGGGSFLIEKFYLNITKQTITRLLIDGEERKQTNSKKMSPSAPEENEIAMAEDMVDVVWTWNSEDQHLDTDELVLLPERTKDCQKIDDLYFYSSSGHLEKNIIKEICILSGLVSSP